MVKKWKKVGSKLIHKNPYYRLYEDDVVQPSGKKGKYYLVRKPPFALIVAMTPRKEVFLIQQHRYVPDKLSWEFPMGFVDKGETPLAAAKRELAEETGIRAKKWAKLGTFHTANGMSDDRAHAYLARALSFGTADFEDSEDFEMKKLGLHDLQKWVKTNKITDGPTLAAYSLLIQHI